MARNVLRVKRAERRISQLDIAAANGMHPSRYWRVENGYAEPTAEERAALARFLGLDSAELWPADVQ